MSSVTPAHRCTAEMWDALLARADLSEAVLEWMIRQATGWPNYEFAGRSRLYQSLLATGRTPLTGRHLTLLTGQESAPDAASAYALLGHPAATVDTVTALLNSVSSAGGYPRFDGTSGARQEQMLRELREDPRAWVRVPARIRGRGLSVWAPRHTHLTLLADIARGGARFAADMAAIGAYGEAGWLIAEDLLRGRPDGEQYLLAVRGVLAEPAEPEREAS